MENPMIDLKNEFQQEASEHLQHVEKELILLEKQPDAPDQERIDIIFRSIHSIKGAAGFMGFHRITELSHLMETLLQMMRQGTVHPERKIIDVLLNGTDVLKSMLDDPDSSNQMDIRRTIENISNVIDTFSTPKTREKMDTSISLSDETGRDIGFSVSEFKLDAIPSDYAYLYLLQYNLHEFQKKEGLTPLSLMRNLLSKGILVDTKIETGAVSFDQDLSEVPLMYYAIYATALQPEAVKTTSGIDGENIVQLRAPVKETQKKYDQDKSNQPEVKPALTDDTCRENPETAPPKEAHELPDTIRIRLDILDKLMKLAGELVLVRNNLLVMTESDTVYRGISQRLNIVTSELQETIMQTRLQPMGNLFIKLPRIVRDLTLKLGKQIEIKTYGNEVELDKTILESLTDPMNHLIRNCCDHGIETPDVRKKAGKPVTGLISVSAYHEAGQINIEISDDGRGIDLDAIKSKARQSGFKTADDLSRMSDKEILSLILAPGFSTAESVSDVSGRGVGMDVVRVGVERLGGAVELESTKGIGTRINLRMPLTLAIISCLLVEVGGNRYAIPQVNLVELVCLYDKEVYSRIESAGDQEVFRLRNRLLPMVRLHDILNRRTPFTRSIRAEINAEYCRITHDVLTGTITPTTQMLNFAVVKIGGRRYGLVVDQVIGVEEIVVNPIHPALKSIQIYAGTTIMGDGTVALILDLEGIARHADIQFNVRDEEKVQQAASGEEMQTVLLFKSGAQEQFAVPLPMIRRVEQIQTSRIEWVGDKEFVTIDGIPNRVLRLEKSLNVSPCVTQEEMLLLLPKHIKRPFGILISEVIDTVMTTLNLNVDSYMEEGLLGTAVIRDHITLFLDMFRLIERADPEWFAERKKNAPPPEKRKRVLLVEDTLFFRNLVKGYLETDGYDVTGAENGQAAIAILQEKDFDIIVSDLDMPYMNGWAFMEYIRKQSSISKIPAIALTALDSEDDRLRAKNAGFNAYQIKLDREELLTNVSKLIIT